MADAPIPTGVVPAAGGSVRMGANKAMLNADGRTFAERVISTLREGGCDPVFVVVADAASPEAAVAISNGAHVLVNPEPGDGPVTSLRRVLEELEAVEAVTVCPVDHPKIVPDTVRALHDAFDGTLAVPTFRDVMGLPVVLGRPLFEELMDPGRAPTIGAVVDRHATDPRRIPVTDRGVVIDIDTLSDYRRHYPDAYRLRFQSR